MKNKDRFNKILYITYPSIKKSNLTLNGKLDMYNHYLRELVNYVENADDFQKISKVYQEYVNIGVKMIYEKK